MANIINLTPHPIVVENDDTKKVYEPSGTVARVEMETKPIGDIDGFYLHEQKVVGHNVPDPQPDTYYIVSAMVLGLLRDREDLIAPDTNNAKRNDKGWIISVPGFVR